MNKFKVTDWFDSHIKPVHKGVYPVKYEITYHNKGTGAWVSGTAYWNGRRWSNMRSGNFIDVVSRYIFTPGAVQDKCWKGRVKS